MKATSLPGTRAQPALGTGFSGPGRSRGIWPGVGLALSWMAVFSSLWMAAGVAQAQVKAQVVAPTSVPIPSAEVPEPVACPAQWQAPAERAEVPSDWRAVSLAGPTGAGAAWVMLGKDAEAAAAPSLALRWPVRSPQALAWRDHHHLAASSRPVVFWRQLWRVPAGREAQLVCSHEAQAQTLAMPLPPASLGWRCEQFAGKTTSDDVDWMWMPATCRPTTKEEAAKPMPPMDRVAMPGPVQRQALMAINTRMAAPAKAQGPQGPGLHCPASLVLQEDGGQGRREVPLSGMGLLTWHPQPAAGQAAAEGVEMLFPDQIDGEEAFMPATRHLGWVLTAMQGLVWMRCEYQGSSVALQRPVMAPGASLTDDPGVAFLQGMQPEEVGQCHVRAGLSRLPLPVAERPSKHSAQAGRRVPWAPESHVMAQVLEARCGP